VITKSTAEMRDNKKVFYLQDCLYSPLTFAT